MREKKHNREHRVPFAQVLSEELQCIAVRRDGSIRAELSDSHTALWQEILIEAWYYMPASEQGALESCRQEGARVSDQSKATIERDFLSMPRMNKSLSMKMPKIQKTDIHQTRCDLFQWRTWRKVYGRRRAQAMALRALVSVHGR